ncbi:galactokinase [Dyadobacter sp. SG02]|uniref:galactokinase n=1 Tax=Dyadobacter sp. SG02 TaxID=1855291 RepID=UPI0008BD2665|nr:galactokinase [Dyadobacter sp. SG02]SEI53955.1 galactokinase [Dyadobacter sp. SG02]
MNTISKDDLTRLFQSVFDGTPDLIVRSPGRINLIGEHTDYNNGFVLPATISQAVYVAMRRREDGVIHLYAADYEEKVNADVAALAPTATWADYILGVADQFQKAGHALPGFELVMTGNIPMGAGLSSSAAIECAVAFGLNEMLQTGYDRLQLVKMAQAAEHAFAGVRCGIMDMFASMFGKKDHAILLDCRSLDYRYVPLAMDGYNLLLFNSNVKHSLASSEYNVRRQECEEGVALLQTEYPEISDLRDVTQEMLAAFEGRMPRNVFKRCSYVVGENARLLAACDDLESNNIAALGKKLNQTHAGLSEAYEVSCPELDFLAQAALVHPAVEGARMVGGGFGGCTINIVREGFADDLAGSVSNAYRQKMDKITEVYHVVTDDGTSLL